jgi:hypothetical protein
MQLYDPVTKFKNRQHNRDYVECACCTICEIKPGSLENALFAAGEGTFMRKKHQMGWSSGRSAVLATRENRDRMATGPVYRGIVQYRRYRPIVS